MSYQLTINNLLRRAVDLYPDREIATKWPDGSTHRYTYADLDARVRKLAAALDALGVDRGDRVATVALNHHRHLELYFAPPCTGRSIHMCNMRLPDEHFQYIINDAEDKVVFVDPQFLEKVEASAPDLTTVEQYVVLDDEVPDTSLEPVVAYEDLLDEQSTDYSFPDDIDEDAECGLCYTSGTTGKPKGVPYTHRRIYLHTVATGHVDAHQFSQQDVVLPVVPMYHANGWGMPYASTFVGAKQVLPTSHTDPATVATLIDEEEVTVSGAVPTVWQEMAEYLDDHPEVDISNIDRLIVGGTAPAESLLRKYDEEYDAPILQGWGMTELGPVGALSVLRKEVEDTSAEDRYDVRRKAGLPVPGIEMRLRDQAGDPVPKDGEAYGELQVRGPWVLDGYHNRPEANEASFTDDGWLQTGDVATIDELGYLDIVDRLDDVIKSGGEWISSVELENELLAHSDVRHVAVVAVDDEQWQERPLAVVVLDDGAEPEPESLADHLGERFPDWWLPDGYVFVDELPRTSTGKLDKTALRDRYA